MNKDTHPAINKTAKNPALPGPVRGYFTRMGLYLGEMYPLPTRLVSSLLFCLSFTVFLQRMHNIPFCVSWYTIVGAGSIFLLLLILRLMDELKDREIDRLLFRERPLPSGKVREPDILFSLGAAVAAYLSVNLWTGTAFWAALFVLGYALLMFKYFFIPEILRRNLLLNLATHNPIVPLMLLYLALLFSKQSHLALVSLNWPRVLLLMAMYWSMALAWELARKIRCREEENAYVTYSQLFGRVGAVALVWTLQTIPLGIGIYFFRELSFSWLFLALSFAGYGMAVWAHLHFLVNPNPVSSKLRPFAEWYMLGVFMAVIADGILYG